MPTTDASTARTIVETVYRHESAPMRRPSWSSIARWPSPCATVRRPGSRSSRRYSAAAAPDRECKAFGDESVFENSRIRGLTRYGEAGREFHRQAPGTVMAVGFDLDGLAFTGLNGPPAFRFTEAAPFQVLCDTQAEIDRYWA